MLPQESCNLPVIYFYRTKFIYGQEKLEQFDQSISKKHKDKGYDTVRMNFGEVKPESTSFRSTKDVTEEKKDNEFKPLSKEMIWDD